MPYWAAAGMALGGLLGGAAQGGISYASAQQQQEAQRDAYKHRYQWTVEDLRKAGLNPVLAAQQGAGSVGPMAQMETPNLAAAMQVASQVGMQNAQADAASAQAGLAQEQTQKTYWDSVSSQVKGSLDNLSRDVLFGNTKGMTKAQKLFGTMNLSQMSGLPVSSLAGPAASAYGSTVNAIGNLGAAGLLKLGNSARGVIKGFAQ